MNPSRKEREKFPVERSIQKGKQEKENPNQHGTGPRTGENDRIIYTSCGGKEKEKTRKEGRERDKEEQGILFATDQLTRSFEMWQCFYLPFPEETRVCKTRDENWNRMGSALLVGENDRRKWFCLWRWFQERGFYSSKILGIHNILPRLRIRRWISVDFPLSLRWIGDWRGRAERGRTRILCSFFNDRRRKC